MILTSPRKSRESILGFGGPKSGKSESPLSLVKYLGDANMHFIDNEWKFDYTIENNFPELFDAKNLIPYRDIDSDNWTELKKLISELRDKVKINDWVVIDSISPTWTACQDVWINKVLGAEDMDTWLMTHDYKELPQGFWQKVNTDYNKFYNLIKSLPCHVYATAQAKEVDAPKPGKDLPIAADLFKVFAPLGVYPAGNKQLSYSFNEVLLFQKGRGETHTMSNVFSASEKTRPYFKEREFTDFAKEYLMSVAKWKPTT